MKIKNLKQSRRGVFLGKVDPHGSALPPSNAPLLPNLWQEYEIRKSELPELSPKEYETAIKGICDDLEI